MLKVVEALKKPVLKIPNNHNHKILEAFNTGADYTFLWTDIFNVAFGIVEGGMAAIPSNTNNYYCGKNTTIARLSLNAMIDDFSEQQEKDGMT